MNELDAGNFTYYETSLMFHGSLMNVMGTKFDILIIGKNNVESEAVWYKVESELKRLHSIMNRFDTVSEISRVNSNASRERVRVSDEMWYILNNCRYYHSKTASLFDITLKEFRTIKFHEKEKSVSFENPNTFIDFGGYGKGYALKKIKTILDESNIQHCFVDFGNSSILGMGHHPHGDAWKVTIENPYNQGQIIDEIDLKDAALSISGNTPSHNGHIIYPGSGKPMNEQKMVSIVSKDPLDAEVLSTAFMIGTRKEKKQLKNGFNIQTIKEYRL